MRLFIAVELEEKIKNAISLAIKKIKIDVLKPKWVNPENCHITLKFLGEVEEKRLPEILDVLKDEALKHKPFIISFGEIGAFPKIDYPRVIWIGIEKGRDFLLQIANFLEDSLFKIGFEKEKRGFSAHLTLARIKEPFKTNCLSPYISKRFISDEMPVKEISLIESKLTPKGSIYTTIKSFLIAESEHDKYTA
ncbi:MAG: RNA 2',3'-cyclic phosphodiesterase [bacterium]